MSAPPCPDCGHPFEPSRASWIDRLERWFRERRGNVTDEQPGQCGFRVEVWDSMCGCQSGFHGALVF